MDVTPNFITNTANRLDQMSPQTAPYFCILCDVLCLSPTDPVYQAAQQRLYQTRHAQELAEPRMKTAPGAASTPRIPLDRIKVDGPLVFLLFKK